MVTTVQEPLGNQNLVLLLAIGSKNTTHNSLYSKSETYTASRGDIVD